jgi:menaquinol-cytochrome c reductase iron-sulfur subunit
MSEGEPLSRRKFFKVATWAIGALISVGLGLPGIAYMVGSALRRERVEDWTPLGATSKVEIDTPTLFKAKVQRKTGWVVDEREVAAYALTEDGRDYVAMSNICTHLGCRVRWVTDQEMFFCPCHNGVFAKDGSVISGPPPRPLDRYDTRVDNGELLILVGSSRPIGLNGYVGTLPGYPKVWNCLSIDLCQLAATVYEKDAALATPLPVCFSSTLWDEPRRIGELVTIGFGPRAVGRASPKPKS